MSTIIPLSTNVLDVVATVTVTAAATATVGANTKYVESFYGAEGNLNVAIFLIVSLVTVIIGLNRMIAVPLIASIAGCIDNAMTWYAFLAKAQYQLHARIVAVAASDVFFGFQDCVLPLYSFFMLEKILSGLQRRVFMGVFGILWFTVVGIRITICAMHVKLFRIPPDDSTAYAHLNGKTNWITRGYFVVIASVEVWSAYFLLRAFYGARHSGRNLGVGASRTRTMFSQLAHSSEVRVATLAGVGITRAICFGFYDVRRGIDRFAYTMENCFPMLLIVDILTTRIVKLQATVDSKAYGESEFSTGGTAALGTKNSATSNTLGSMSGKGAVDTVEREFPAYAGKSMSVSLPPGIPTVVEISEDTIEGGEKERKDDPL